MTAIEKLVKAAEDYTAKLNARQRSGIWSSLDFEKIAKDFELNLEASKVELNTVKCTCGVKFTGGEHSDWCDTNNPPPDTEELPF